MNIMMVRGPAGFASTTDALLANTESRDVIKCFNMTGFNNRQNTVYGSEKLDMFTVGDSPLAIQTVQLLGREIGFKLMRR